eukprot:TRINITY_DN33993_c0_g1_i1.p1 TRINITY_DN33993_c0_g1~~TRINITY_DN33993_c0_g1_i1.p1  ORF type:complete len:382 (-),score=63.87 TRINITY_DN33993_c0_g1_i1:141-1286(-)
MVHMTCFSLQFCSTLLILHGSLGHKNIDAERKRCSRPQHLQGSRQPNDLNSTFEPIRSGAAFAEFSPKVLSTDPWIVYFENFMNEEEVAALEQHLFANKEEEFKSSAAGGSGTHQARYSETAFCVNECDNHATLQHVRHRAASVVNAPPENFDFSQALRYKQGMFYKSHHDNHPSFHYSPTGARIFTYFVYFSDAGLEGGQTNFPKLGIKAPAKRGAAVLFVNTRDRNPMETDPRTLHESLPVTSGLKRGMNMWIYQYNYRDSWKKGCTSIELADELEQSGKAAADVIPKVTFANNAKKTTLHVYLASVRQRGYVDGYTPGRYLGAVEPGESNTFETVEGDVLLLYNKQAGGKLIKEYSVKANAIQRVNMGKDQKKHSAEL